MGRERGATYGGGGQPDPISEGQLLDVLDEALDAKIIEELTDEVGHYQFTHALMQETLTGELSLTRRVRIHARIAEAQERLYGDEAVEHAAELAYHYGEAEAVLGAEKYVRYAVAAGEKALANHAPSDARPYFTRAWGIVRWSVSSRWMSLRRCTGRQTRTP